MKADLNWARLDHKGHANRARRCEVEAELGVEPMRVAVGDQADVGPLGSGRVQLFDKGGDDRLAEAPTLVGGCDGDVDDLEE